MSEDKAIAYLKKHYPAVFSALEKGKYIRFDVLTLADYKAGYKMPAQAHYNVLHSPDGLILEVLPPEEAERIRAYRIATAESMIASYLEQRKAAFTALLHKPAQKTERKAAFTALTDPKALLIQAPAGDIAPQHTTPEHKPPGNYITQAYKQLTPDNYFREIHAEAISPITSYPFLMAEALRRYLDWIDSQEGSQAEKKTPKKGTPENPTQWQLAAYYRYLTETDYPTPFDNHKTQPPAFEEIVKQHSQYTDRSPGGFKQQWNKSNTRQRTDPAMLEDLRVVLKMLKDYPRAAEKCKDEIRVAQKRLEER